MRGSTFSIENYELSNPIHDDKIGNTIPGSATVTIGCPACIMHIADGQARHGSDIKAVHTTKRVAKVCGPRLR
ncbi:MAG: hypothetical protein ACNI3A_02810 [Desulfovibrio sp.]|uniref:hypothetical protein n=1 Tax=Desulfovibrio sp. 7SRBS1 TaxID=3378064 RepID=UPI003B3D0308